MHDLLRQFDVGLLLSVNGLNSPLWDVVMAALSSSWTWVPVLGAALWLLARRHGWRGLLLAILSAGCVYGITAVGVKTIKASCQRLRPFLHADLAPQLHLPADLPGSAFGFVSTHTAAAFALAVFCALLLQRRWSALVLPLWAGTVAYSRVYLGVHFPSDVIGGALWGTAVAFGGYACWRLYAGRLLAPAPLPPPAAALIPASR